MKTLIVAAAALLVATPLMAQERGGPDARGYVMGLGGFSVSTGGSTGNSLLEGGIGVARLNPSAHLASSSGIMPDGSTPDVGTDITTQIVTTGAFTNPPSSTARLTTLGGGVQVPLAQPWVVDAGYRYSRIAADTTLSAAPLNTNGMTFGFGDRF